MRLVRSIAQGRGQPAPHQGQLYLLMAARISPFGGGWLVVLWLPPPIPPPPAVDPGNVVRCGVFVLFIAEPHTPTPQESNGTNAYFIYGNGNCLSLAQHNTHACNAIHATRTRAAHAYTHIYTHTRPCAHTVHIYTLRGGDLGDL